MRGARAQVPPTHRHLSYKSNPTIRAKYGTLRLLYHDFDLKRQWLAMPASRIEAWGTVPKCLSRPGGSIYLQHGL